LTRKGRLAGFWPGRSPWSLCAQGIARCGESIRAIRETVEPNQMRRKHGARAGAKSSRMRIKLPLRRPHCRGFARLAQHQFCQQLDACWESIELACEIRVLRGSWPAGGRRVLRYFFSASSSFPGLRFSEPWRLVRVSPKRPRASSAAACRRATISGWDSTRFFVSPGSALRS